ncbi:MAG: ABC transporter permease [Pleomorphochaeta sp.]
MITVLNSTLNLFTPLFLISLGAIITSISGTLNIALEGLTLISALFAIIGANLTNSLFLGVIFGILSSLILAAIISGVNATLKTNPFITALSSNMIASALTLIITYSFYNSKGLLRLEITPIQLLNIPILGRISPFLPLSLILFIVVYILIEKTPFGLKLKACGYNPMALDSYGISKIKLDSIAFLLSSIFCGLAGSYLSLRQGAFISQMSANKGWFALVIVFLCQSNIKYLIPSALLFALSEALSNYAQGLKNLPADIALIIPSLFTLIVMIIISYYNKQKQKIEEKT